MNISENLRIDQIQGQAKPNQSAEKAADPTEFRRLLEKLEALAKTPKASDVEDLSQLEDAVRSADDDFKQVMEMREMLESAYKRAQP